MCPLNITLLQKTKNVINSKTDFYLVASNQQNIMITTEKVLWETKSVPLINITRSWEWLDCGVNPYKYSLIFQKRFTARI